MTTLTHAEALARLAELEGTPPVATLVELLALATRQEAFTCAEVLATPRVADEFKAYGITSPEKLARFLRRAGVQKIGTEKKVALWQVGVTGLTPP